MHVNLIGSIERGWSFLICCLNNWIPGILPILKLGPNRNEATQRMAVSWIPGKRCIRLKVNVPHSTIQHKSMKWQRQIHNFFWHTIALQMLRNQLPLHCHWVSFHFLPCSWLRLIEGLLSWIRLTKVQGLVKALTPHSWLPARRSKLSFPLKSKSSPGKSSKPNNSSCSPWRSLPLTMSQYPKDTSFSPSRYLLVHSGIELIGMLFLFM